MMDTEYKTRQAQIKAENAMRYAELSKLGNQEIYDIVAQGPKNNRGDYVKACRIMEERTGIDVYRQLGYLWDFDEYYWEN